MDGTGKNVKMKRNVHTLEKLSGHPPRWTAADAPTAAMLTTATAMKRNRF